MRVLHERVICVRYGADEPLPEWRHVNEGRLASALIAPQPVFDVDAYPTLGEKAAVLLYAIAKAHALSNGNKRTAMTATFVFLAMNGQWWSAESEDVRAHVAWVAASDARARSETLAYMRKYFEAKLVPFDLAQSPRWPP
jgi:death-on-curing family protein